MALDKPTSPATEFEYLAGLVERVTFHNEQNGFCVLRLKVKGEHELITLIGHTPMVSPGEYASASGAWVTDREHGRQFRAVFVKISPPTTLTGIERYLGSGMVKGIGPVYASPLTETDPLMLIKADPVNAQKWVASAGDLTICQTPGMVCPIIQIE